GRERRAHWGVALCGRALRVRGGNNDFRSVGSALPGPDLSGPPAPRAGDAYGCDAASCAGNLLYLGAQILAAGPEHWLEPSFMADLRRRDGERSLRRILADRLGAAESADVRTEEGSRGAALSTFLRAQPRLRFRLGACRVSVPVAGANFPRPEPLKRRSTRGAASRRVPPHAAQPVAQIRRLALEPAPCEYRRAVEIVELMERDAGKRE